MEFRSDSLDFSLPLRGSGPRTASRTFVFPRTVRTATAGLAGYVAEYSNNDDHHLGRLEIRLDTTVLANTVTVDGRFGVRDWSGDWDDEYAGAIDIVVVAELEAVTEPPPRGDLIITGMELNQAVQHFRSTRFLDPANARPDNSIFLIARKNTGVRVYVDWDSTAGLPPIANLTGELIVSTGASTRTLTPINPGGSITPKRDANINQVVADDTLNFMIPAAICAGVVTVRCNVFDQAAPGSRSAAFTRTLVFVPVAPLNIFLVGVTLTSPALPAPTQAQISASLSMVTSTYPRGDIIQTGFSTITNNGVFTGPAPSSGCGSGWDNLVDALQDLRGGSTDVYYGSLPAGLVCVASVGGCSPTGDGVAAGFVDVPVIAAHEIGHAMNRRHATCAGCVPGPQNPDPNFPQYNGFNSDSIGVFGFDPTTNTVFNPAAVLDFMSMSVAVGCTSGSVTSVSTRWISPYTYQGLLGATVGGPPGALVLLNRPQMTLFLGLTIARDRSVKRRFSFHYEAPPQGRGGCSTSFTYELLDAKKEVLDCGPLHCRCTGNCDCWPKTTRDALPMMPGARWLVVWEGDQQIYEEEIPDPPEVRIVGMETRQDGVLLRWDSDGPADVWYVLHWLDKRGGGVRRGVAPRLQEKSLLVPRQLFASGPELHVRVYATSGIATGFADAVLELEGQHQPGGKLILVGGPSDATSDDGKPQRMPHVLTVSVTDSAGGQVPSDRIAWYDAQGGRITEGNQLDVRSLPMGKHVVRAVVRGLGTGTIGKSWLIERSAEGTLLHHVICDPPPKRSHEEHQHPHPAPPRCD
jgi:hypothetical protein